MFLFTFTMFFSGGMIPMYLTVQQLHIYNTTWAMVLPVAVSAYNLIVCRSFFESGIPVELLEAAKIDGCSDFGFFFKIAIPLSKTIIAVMCLFHMFHFSVFHYFVGNCNCFSGDFMPFCSVFLSFCRISVDFISFLFYIQERILLWRAF